MLELLDYVDSLPPWLDLSWDAIELTSGEHPYMFNFFKNWRYTEEGGS